MRVGPVKPVHASALPAHTGEPSFAVPLSGLSEKRGKALGRKALDAIGALKGGIARGALDQTEICMPIVDAYLKDELEGAGWTVRPDPIVERGGCKSHAATGEIDATNVSRWERVVAALGRNKPW